MGEKQRKQWNKKTHFWAKNINERTFQVNNKQKFVQGMHREREIERERCAST